MGGMSNAFASAAAIAGGLVGLTGCAGATDMQAAASQSAGLSQVAMAQPRRVPGATNEQRLLAAHNFYRAQAGVPPLTWDPALAAGAASYGPVLAAQGRLVHSPRAGRPGIAENLWVGSAGAYTPEAMVANWAEERTWFRDGIFPNVSSTGNWLDVSHYTQMIWRGTTRVGCAIHRTNGRDWLICRYSPRGNRDGQSVR